MRSLLVDTLAVARYGGGRRWSPAQQTAHSGAHAGPASPGLAVTALKRAHVDGKRELAGGRGWCGRGSAAGDEGLVVRTNEVYVAAVRYSVSLTPLDERAVRGYIEVQQRWRRNLHPVRPSHPRQLHDAVWVAHR